MSLRFATDPKLGNFAQMSTAQRVLYRVMSGETLEGADELRSFRKHAGYDYPGLFQPKYVLAVTGRRGGKSRTIALRAVEETVLGGHEKYLADGETGVFLIVAQDMKIASGVIFKYCKALFERSPMLRKYLDGDPVANVIRLKVNNRNIEIRVQAADRASIRGWTVLGFIGDEAAFWKFDGVNVDKQVLDSVIPGALTIPDAKFFLITTPWTKQGLVWDTYSKCWGTPGADWFVFNASTFDMNTNLTPKVKAELAKMQVEDPETYRREVMGEFIDPITGWLPAPVIDAAVSEGVTERPFQSNCTYVAAMDPAFVHDQYTFTVVHRGEHDELMQDHVYGWESDRKSIAIDAFVVIAHIANICKKYRIRTLYTDQGSSEVIMQMFQRSAAWQQINTRIEKIHITNVEKREEFNTLKSLILNSKMHLLDHKKTLHELKNLEVKNVGNGGVQIGAPRLAGYKDDYACCLAMASHYAYTAHQKADHEYESRKIHRIIQEVDYGIGSSVEANRFTWF